MKAVKIDFVGGMPRLSGQVWNPTDESINALGMKVEIVNLDGQVLWSKETRVVDEYVPPLGAREGKAVDITGGESVKADGKSQFKVYFDGKLYNSYPIGLKEKKVVKEVEKEPAAETTTENNSAQPLPTPMPGTLERPEPPAKNSAEEKTMKDLE